HRLITHAFLERSFDIIDDRAVLHVDARPCLIDGYTRLETGKDVCPVIPPVLKRFGIALRKAAHRNRDVNVRHQSERRAFETRRPHTNECQLVAINNERLVEDVRAGIKTIAPVRVAQNYNGRRADGPIVRGSDQTPKRWLNSQYRKITSGYQNS